MRILISSFLISSFILFTYSCKNSNPKIDKEASNIEVKNKKEVDAIIDSLVDKQYFPGIYTRVEDKNGNPIYEHGKINSELFPNQKIDKDSWFRIWSMSKIVTICLAMDLVEENIIQIDEPVTKYIPEFEHLKVAVSPEGEKLVNAKEGIDKCPIQMVPNQSEMTIKDLLTHKAGFFYATTGIKCLDSLISSKNIASSKNTQDFIDHLATLPLIQQSGDEYFYGINTTVLGFILERATNKSLKTLVEERITTPMKITGLQYSLDINKLIIPPMSGKNDTLRIANSGELDIFGEDVPSYQPSSELYLGGEGMVATADGYTDFLRMLVNGGTLNGHRFLEESSIKEISSPHTQLDNEYGYNGYNLWISSEKFIEEGTGDEGLWIGGGYEGTHFWADPKRKLVGVIMTQMNFINEKAGDKDGKIRGAIYQSILTD